MNIRESIRNILKKHEESEYLMLEFIQAHCRNSFFDFFFYFISKLTAAGFIWFILAFYLLFINFKEKARNIEQIALAIALLFALSLHILASHYYIKNAIARQRPQKERSIASSTTKSMPQENTETKRSYSFPSGHVCSSFASACLLFLYNSPFFTLDLLFVWLFVFLVAFSRIYLYEHFPSDVFAGMLLGIVFALISYAITQQFIDLLSFS